MRYLKTSFYERQQRRESNKKYWYSGKCEDVTDQYVLVEYEDGTTGLEKLPEKK